MRSLESSCLLINLALLSGVLGGLLMIERRGFYMPYMINDASLSLCTLFGGLVEGLVLRFVKYKGDIATWLDSWQEV